MNNYLSWVCYDCYAYEANGVDALTYIEDDTPVPCMRTGFTVTTAARRWPVTVQASSILAPARFHLPVDQ